jgi:hypothetical protein
MSVIGLGREPGWSGAVATRIWAASSEYAPHLKVLDLSPPKLSSDFRDHLRRRPAGFYPSGAIVMFDGTQIAVPKQVAGHVDLIW